MWARSSALPCLASHSNLGRIAPNKFGAGRFKVAQAHAAFATLCGVTSFLSLYATRKAPRRSRARKKSGHGVTQHRTSVRNLCEIRWTTVHDEPNTTNVNRVQQSRCGMTHGGKSPSRIPNRPRRAFGHEPISTIFNRGKQCGRAIMEFRQRPGRIGHGLWRTMFDQPRAASFDRIQQCGKRATTATAQFRTGP